jgi:endonuclease YncB( thermonuclease family)
VRTYGSPVLTRISVLFALVAGSLALAGPAHAIDHDCADFSSQAAAQKYYVALGGPRVDPDRLDADNDGTACDSLPCPCSSSTQPVAAQPSTAPRPTLRQWARVVHIVDGDTIDVRMSSSGYKRRVLVLGIDTPEVYGGVECGGPAASRSMVKILPLGTRVKLVSDPTQARKDRYGRLLRYVMKGLVDAGRRQLVRGHARVYVYHQVPFTRVRAYRAAAAYARNHDLGIWRMC